MNTRQIAAEAARQAFIDHESYVQKRDVWRMPPQLPLTEELLTEIIEAASEKATKELSEANNNLFKIARKYCLENKALREKEKTK